MCFEVGLKRGYCVDGSDVRGEGVPEAWGGAAEGSSPHGGQTGRGDDEVGGGGRSEAPGGDIGLDEVR